MQTGKGSTVLPTPKRQIEPGEGLESELAALGKKPLSEIRSLWIEHLGTKPPPIRAKNVLIYSLAWHLQAKRHGGLSAATTRRLLRHAQRRERAGQGSVTRHRVELAPGTLLKREWQGRMYTVTVLADGFEYDGARYNSLSEIARLITGTRWSGPVFFGLKKRKSDQHKHA